MVKSPHLHHHEIFFERKDGRCKDHKGAFVNYCIIVAKTCTIQIPLSNYFIVKVSQSDIIIYKIFLGYFYQVHRLYVPG